MTFLSDIAIQTHKEVNKVIELNRQSICLHIYICLLTKIKLLIKRKNLSKCHTTQTILVLIAEKKT